VPGLGQQIAQQGVDVNDSIGGAEKCGVKFKPAQKRESSPGFDSGQQFGGHALFVELCTPFGGWVWLSVSQV
jgi:hypothetical protein